MISWGYRLQSMYIKLTKKELADGLSGNSIDTFRLKKISKAASIRTLVANNTFSR